MSWLLTNRLTEQHYRHEETRNLFLSLGCRQALSQISTSCSHAQQMQIHRGGSCQGDPGQGDSTHARETHSISDTNAASAQPAVRSTQRCSPGKPRLPRLRGLLQVQGGMSDLAAVSVVAGLTWPFPTNKDWQPVDIGVWCSSKIKSFWGNKGRRSERRFITRQLESFSSWN